MKRLGRVGLVLGVLTLGGMTACGEKENPAAKQHRIKGSDHFSKKEWKEAAAEYALSLQADPKQEKIWEAKAFAHMQAGETDQAVETLLKTLDFKTEPAQKAELYRNLASICMKNGPLDKAEEFFNEVLKLEPKDEFALGWLAEIYSQRGGARSMTAPVVPTQLEKALEYYDKVIALNPNSAPSYLNKRIVMAKYMAHEQKLKEEAEKELAALPKKELAAKQPAILARVTEHQTRIDGFKAQFDELTKKFSEAQKATKAQQAQQAEAKP